MFGFDLVALIKAAGYLGLFGIIFAESGFLVGFFLPGDSLLFTAGILASQNFLDITTLMIITLTGAILGDSFGYYLGKKFGQKIFVRQDSIFFNQDHVARAASFYNKHGGKAIVLARFMPVVRTLAPILAGVGQMRYSAFLFYNITGGILWAIGLASAGYYLGNVIPDIDSYLLPIVVLIIAISILPSAIHILKNKTHRQKIAGFIKSKIRK